MTRLITEWIADIESTIKSREEQLKAKTGLDYTALAAKAGGCSAYDIKRAAQAVKVAVVPITSGLGVIGSFSQSVAAVTGVMGFESFVTEHTDVDGIYEACKKGADLLYLADDERFIAMNLHKNKVADNNIATASGYTAALEGAVGALSGKEILLLGYGVVGREFLKLLRKKGAAVAVYDHDPEKQKELKAEAVRTITNPEEISEFRYLIDATSQGGWLKAQYLHPEVFLVTPGVPLSLDETAYQKYSGSMVHDCLEIGVAVMLGMAL